ncbi:hypothetical protein CCP2SC5_740016 [Azospirillaceae bacterium]
MSRRTLPAYLRQAQSNAVAVAPAQLGGHGPRHRTVETQVRADVRSFKETITGARQYLNVPTWDDFTRLSGIAPIDPYDKAPISPALAAQLLDDLAANAEAMIGLQQAMASTRVAIPPSRQVYSTEAASRTPLEHGFKLKLRQAKAFDKLVDLIQRWHKNPTTEYSGAFLPLEPGQGKSFITAAILIYMQREGLLSPFGDPNPVMAMLYRAFILTPASVVPKTKRTFEMLGVKAIDSQVIIGSHQSLGTQRFKALFNSYETEFYGQQQQRFGYPMMPPPSFVNIDESHKYKYLDSVCTKYAMAWADLGQTFFLFTSATPGVTLMDTAFMSMACRVKYLGTPVRRESVKAFYHTINGNSRVPIDEPNDAAMLRYRDYISSIVVCPPRDPQTVKCHNQVVILPIKTQEERTFYFTAQDRWVEERAKLGEGISDEGAVMASFMILRQAEEQIKVKYLVERALEKHRRGKAPVIMWSFQDSVRDSVIMLTEAGVPRNKISVIWGGATKIDPKDILTPAEVAEYYQIKTQGGELPKEINRRLKKSLLHYREQVKRELSPADQAIRNRKLEELNLFRQNTKQRDEEVQRFQNGETEFCLVTLSAGGTGIDLDQQFEHVRPRDVDLTVCYYAEEIKQGAGRCYRIATLSDVQQSFCFFEGTIAAQHVAPKLDRKLSSMGALSSGNIDFVTLLNEKADHGKLAEVETTKFRTAEDIAAEPAEDPTQDEDDDDDDDDKE